jgi:hypothetical protein
LAIIDASRRHAADCGLLTEATMTEIPEPAKERAVEPDMAM